MSNDNLDLAHWRQLRRHALIEFIRAIEFERMITHDTVFRGAMADLMNANGVDLVSVANDGSQHLNLRITVDDLKNWTEGFFDPLGLSYRKEFFTMIVLPALLAAARREVEE